MLRVNNLVGFGRGVFRAKPLGLSPLLLTETGEDTGGWKLESVDVADYIGNKGRLVFYYVSGSNHLSDLQIDDIQLGTTAWDPETGTNGFEAHTPAGTVTDYSSVSWTALTTSEAGEGLWLRDSLGTTSNDTGLSSGYTGDFYYYCETSLNGKGFPNKSFWLRSPEVDIDSSVLSFALARDGVDIGTLEVYIDVTGVY